MKKIKALWSFCRPHTVVGTVISIITLFILICTHDKIQYLPLLSVALAVGITSNIFIVGINQIADINIDKINKPYLPIPAGELSLKEAKIVVVTALLISLFVALFVSVYLFLIIVISSFIGWAYSMPPMHLKKHHITAALAITFVRGLLINVGGFLVFNYIVNKSFDMPVNLKILTVFILIFSVVIAWFKDLPDIDGDSKYAIKSFAIVYSPKAAFISGNVLIVLAYLFTVFLKSWHLHSEVIATFQTKTLVFGHIFLLILFVINAMRIDLGNKLSVKKFYKKFWLFFFAEYLIYLFAYLF